MADYTIKSGDTQPVLTDTLTYSDGTVVNLTGATLTFVMRDHTAAASLSLTGAASVTNAVTGAVKYTPSAADTAAAGLYMGNWVVVFADTTRMTFPTVGYIWIAIEESLTTTASARTLVSLPDVKDYLNIPASDRTHDAKLMRFITSVRPVVESLTGPILPAVYREFHRGGHNTISLRRKPSTALGTDPILDLIGVTEWQGPTAFPLKIVADAGHGETYSCLLDPRLGTVTRRTTGGGTMAFPGGDQSVYVVYRAGQNSVPANVYEGTLELLRLHYQRTQQAGRSRSSAFVDDDEPTGTPVGFFVSGKVRELLMPNKKRPSIA